MGQRGGGLPDRGPQPHEGFRQRTHRLGGVPEGVDRLGQLHRRPGGEPELPAQRVHATDHRVVVAVGDLGSDLQRGHLLVEGGERCRGRGDTGQRARTEDGELLAGSLGQVVQRLGELVDLVGETDRVVPGSADLLAVRVYVSGEDNVSCPLLLHLPGHSPPP